MDIDANWHELLPASSKLQFLRRQTILSGVSGCGSATLTGCIGDNDHNENPRTDGGDEFVDHGPVGSLVVDRGWVGTADGAGDDVVLVWLYDQDGGWLGMINVDSGEYEAYFPDIEDSSIGAPFSSLLSTRNRFYACNRHFVEFDPTNREFTVIEANVDGGEALAMSMTEDDGGVIWAATYPDTIVTSYDPKTKEFQEYAPVYEHSSSQYPRSIAVDDQGWVYVGINPAAGQIVMLDRETGEATPVLTETLDEESPTVVRDTNGVVYGEAGDRWFELYDGDVQELSDKPRIDEKSIITGSQNLSHPSFPSGRQVTDFEVAVEEPYLDVFDPATGETQTVPFEIDRGRMSPSIVARAPDGTLAGGATRPSLFFAYDPETDVDQGEDGNAWFRDRTVGLYRTAAAADDRLYFGTYPQGMLLEWDPDKEWDPPTGTTRQLRGNPRNLTGPSKPEVGRPYDLLVHPDGRHVVLSGMPDYGYTGGGLVLWDRKEESAAVLGHEEVVRWHSTASMVALPDGSLLGGTTVVPAMGGERKAEVAGLYVMDLNRREVRWSAMPWEVGERVMDMVVAPNGIVVGIIDQERLFAFDPDRRTVVREANLDRETASSQAPEDFVRTPDGRLFLLFADGTIGEVDPETLAVRPQVESPVPIRNGGAYRDNRLYFVTDGNLYSWQVPLPD